MKPYQLDPLGETAMSVMVIKEYGGVLFIDVPKEVDTPYWSQQDRQQILHTREVRAEQICLILVGILSPVMFVPRKNSSDNRGGLVG